MIGKIMKGIAGFYYVHVEDHGTYECKARGNFRNKKVKPLVGDEVEITCLDEEKKLGNIDVILPRKNSLIRPNVANIDQALIVFAVKDPQPNFNLLDRFLIAMEHMNIPTVICFNKIDLIPSKQIEEILDIYKKSGSDVYFTSMKEKEGVEAVREILRGKTTALAGPSGVGKSTLFNAVSPKHFQMETGSVSEKIRRGKHTTRHSELFHIAHSTYIMDTPGFSSLSVFDIDEKELKDYYYEFEEYEPFCKFQGCLHIKEPVCGVRTALEDGKINQIRYENYLQLYEEVKGQKKW